MVVNKSKTFMKLCLAAIIVSELVILSVVKAVEKDSSSFHCEDSEVREQCWDDILSNTIKERGIDEGMALFDRLLATEEKFADNCHSYAHTLGKEVYLVYGSDYKKIPYFENMAVCGYGFFHGLLEVVTAKSGELRDVRNFCNLFRENNLKGRDYYECYHGVGHGAVARHEIGVTTEPKEWVNLALKTCEHITDSDKEMEFCARGVFMRSHSEIVSTLKLKRELVDRFGILASCADQEGDYAKWCYQAQGRFLLVSENNNFEKATTYIANVEDLKLRKTAIYELAISMSKTRGRLTLTEQIELCQTTGVNIRQACINGLVFGILLYSQNQSDIKTAEGICSNPVMDESYRLFCRKEIAMALNYFTQK